MKQIIKPWDFEYIQIHVGIELVFNGIIFRQKVRTQKEQASRLIALIAFQ